MNQLPELHQAMIDEITLETLFRDITAFGKDIEVTPKRRARQQVEGESMTLSQAMAALRDQSARAVQVRYTHQGVCWCDTLAPGDGGWRLTRINLSEAATA